MSEQARADSRTASIRHMREVAAVQVETTSLRQVAREIGMSPTGLKKFLAGTSPYAPTVRRLRNWYVRYAAAQPSGVELADADAAVAVLVHDLGVESRRWTAVQVLEAVGSGYAHNAKSTPPWLVELRTRYAAA